MARDTTLLDAFARQQGLACIDDLDAEPERLSLQPHHELIIAVEFCTAPRPSKLGSLRGSSEKYVSMFDAMGDALGGLRGEGTLSLRKASPTEVTAAALAPLRGVMTPARPQSANARLRGGGAADDVEPRIGSFEVLAQLVNRQSGQKYGPVQIHSKLQTRRWPLFDKLRQRLDMHLQEFLGKDTGHFEFHEAKAREQRKLTAAQEQRLQREGFEAPNTPSEGEAPAAPARDERPQSAPMRKAPPTPAAESSAPAPDENAAPQEEQEGGLQQPG